jgi:nucleotide-binding universal stress UspA family protein
MSEIRNIFFATDFSPASEPARARAIELARKFGAGMTVLHVLELPAAVGSDPFWSAGTYEAMEEAARASAANRMEQTLRLIRDEGIEASADIVTGIPAREICREAERRHADMIVMGTEGRNAFTRLFLGSVANRVVAHAPCPVLTVRAKLAEHPIPHEEAPDPKRPEPELPVR